MPNATASVVTNYWCRIKLQMINDRFLFHQVWGTSPPCPYRDRHQALRSENIVGGQAPHRHWKALRIIPGVLHRVEHVHVEEERIFSLGDKPVANEKKKDVHTATRGLHEKTNEIMYVSIDNDPMIRTYVVYIQVVHRVGQHHRHIEQQERIVLVRLVLW